MHVQDALDAIIIPAGYAYTVGENLLRVYGGEVQTRLFTLNYMTGVRSGITQLSASSGSASGSGGSGGASTSASSGAQSSSSVNSEVSTAPWDEIIAGLEMIVYGSALVSGATSADGPERLVVHPPSGVILVTASYAKLNRVADFLERIEGSSHRQVAIEARIVEVTLDDEFHLGVDWSRIPGTGGVTSVFGNDEMAVEQALSLGNSVFRVAGSSGDFDAFLDALGEQGNLRVISSPQITTINNQKAMIKVAREESFFTLRVEYEYQPDGSRTPVASVEPERITIGLILDVTPQISAQGGIMMHVHPSVTELVGEDIFPPEASGSDIQANAPILDIREVDTVVRVESGEMLIIGGLTRQREVKRKRHVPFLGQIPLLGYLFSRTERITEQTELVILLRPRVVVGEEATHLALSELERLSGPAGD
jgi:MSHA biogenesis protein MshL